MQSTKLYFVFVIQIQNAAGKMLKRKRQSLR